MSIAFRFEDAFSELTLRNDDPKIRQLQDLDRCKAEKAHQVPLNFKVNSVSFEASLPKKKEPRFVMQVAAVDSAWQVTFSLRDIKELTANLQKAFPIEAGKIGNHKCIMPKPPVNLKKAAFWSSSKSVEKLRSMQLEMVQKYVQELLDLPEYIRHSKLIVDFFLRSAPSIASPTPPPSSTGETSMSFVSSSSSESSKELPIKRIKVKIGDELILVGYNPESGFKHLQQSVKDKFSAILGDSFQCPRSFRYKEPGSSDEITIEDDEDLEIACGSKEDWRKRKELEEARKAGTIPAERDEEGNEINPHIPQYIAKAPWYMDTGAPSLKHQRHKEEEIKSDLHHVRGQVEPAEPVRKFRKGACENCGSMSHKAKDCLERPRKVGAKFTGKDIRPDDFVKTAELNFDGKRDRWAGYDAEEYAAVVETFEKVEDERRKLKEAEMEVALQAKLANGENDSDSLSSSDSESSSSEDEKYAEKVDMPGQKVDTKSRMTVRNLRMREDTAKYLRNLDPESAYYDPKTRSMRDNPHPEAADPSMLPFAGDNFVRQSGEALEIPKLQVFAWQASERGIDISLQANPSYAEKMHKEHLRQKSEEAKRREQLLLEAYGSSADTSASSTKRDLVIPDEDDVYVEYSKDGNRITKVRKTA